MVEGELNVTTGQKLIYMPDQLGSVRDVLDGTTGTLVAAYDYAPYGSTDRSYGSTPTDYRFAGLLYHSASSLNLGTYRALDGVTGRFINRDAAGFRSGINLYDYTYSNPIILRDPSGLTVTCYYGQNNGQLICYNDANGQQVVNTTGYAGGNLGKNREGVNDSDYQYQQYVGPLPWGDYSIGQDNGRMGPLSLPPGAPGSAIGWPNLGVTDRATECGVG